jgi:hypothetical protein
VTKVDFCTLSFDSFTPGQDEWTTLKRLADELSLNPAPSGAPG